MTPPATSEQVREALTVLSLAPEGVLADAAVAELAAAFACDVSAVAEAAYYRARARAVVAVAAVAGFQHADQAS